MSDFGPLIFPMGELATHEAPVACRAEYLYYEVASLLVCRYESKQRLCVDPTIVPTLA
ncbi:hypothetical protein J2W15_001903 [Pseudarthrobacter sulfonivorans]|nr:hypothetical protein [Pseudarthrobacter sulfonivorans]